MDSCTKKLGMQSELHSNNVYQSVTRVNTRVKPYDKYSASNNLVM